MPYSIDALQDDCYPGTSVLINRYDIRDQSKLDEVEGVLTSARYAAWMAAPQSDRFDFAHYRSIHCAFGGVTDPLRETLAQLLKKK